MSSVELLFDKDEADTTTKSNFKHISIPKRSIIISPILYSYFRSKPKQTKYRIELELEKSYEPLITNIFSTEKSNRKGYNYVNTYNKEFLVELNKILNIRPLQNNIENFKHDEIFIEDNVYKNFKIVQELIHSEKKKDEEEIYGKLFDNIEVLNQMKISSNILSFRNRIYIMERIINLKNKKLFKNYISKELDNEIQEFQKEIDKINRKKLNDKYKYDTIIDIIRYDDSSALQTIISSEVNFDYEKKYDFIFDFTDLLPKKATIFELTIYFNSVNCYMYVMSNHIKPKEISKKETKLLLANVPKFAFASGNSEMIRFCEQNKILSKTDYSIYLDISIAYQNNHLYTWLFENFHTNITENSPKLAIISNNVSILSDLIYDFGANLNSALFQAFDNDNIEILSFLIQLKSSNINYGMSGINIFIDLYSSYSSCCYRRKN